MKFIYKIFLLIITILFIGCQNIEKQKIDTKKSNHVDSIRKYKFEFEKLNKYFSNTNLTLCEYNKAIDTIKQNAIIVADKKYPNEIAKHDKYCEAYYNKHQRIFLNKFKIADSLTFKAYFIGKLFCEK